MTCDEVFYRQYLSGDDAGLEALMKKYGDQGTLRKEGAPRRLLYLRLISFRKRCNPCGYAVFSLLRSARWCWKASSISSGVSSWRMPTPL